MLLRDSFYTKMRAVTANILALNPPDLILFILVVQLPFSAPICQVAKSSKKGVSIKLFFVALRLLLPFTVSAAGLPCSIGLSK